MTTLILHGGSEGVWDVGWEITWSFVVPRRTTTNNMYFNFTREPELQWNFITHWTRVFRGMETSL